MSLYTILAPATVSSGSASNNLAMLSAFVVSVS
jgi:hypothetical protein